MALHPQDLFLHVRLLLGRLRGRRLRGLAALGALRHGERRAQGVLLLLHFELLLCCTELFPELFDLIMGLGSLLAFEFQLLLRRIKLSLKLLHGLALRRQALAAFCQLAALLQERVALLGQCVALLRELAALLRELVPLLREVHFALDGSLDFRLRAVRGLLTSWARVAGAPHGGAAGLALQLQLALDQRGHVRGNIGAPVGHASASPGPVR
mmetsp:Transcript_108449/g.317274  ORF Transcript_108449/g.317274 Transcript_108449/m.317274 type:complete len:212 (-) Transcript_108449:537-1172(-)